MSQANVSYKDVLSQLSSLDKVIVRKEFALVFASQMKTSKYMYPFCNKMTSHTTEEKIQLRIVELILDRLSLSQTLIIEPSSND